MSRCHLPKRMVSSLTRKLDTGPTVAWLWCFGKNPHGSDDGRGRELVQLDPSELPAALSRRYLERELLTVTGIGSRVDGLWGLCQNTCKDDFDGPSETLLLAKTG